MTANIGVIAVSKWKIVIYICPTSKARYFDSGNFIYGVTMKLLVRTTLCNWNDETMGDFFESFIGGWLLLSQDPREAHCSRYGRQCFEQLSIMSRYWVHTLAAFEHCVL